MKGTPITLEEAMARCQQVAEEARRRRCQGDHEPLEEWDADHRQVMIDRADESASLIQKCWRVLADWETDYEPNPHERAVEALHRLVMDFVEERCIERR